MKHSIIVLGIGLVASCKGAGGAQCDMSTRESIAATFKQVTGKNVSPDCSEISTTFPGIAKVGIFANDRGCMTQGMLVDCKPPTDGYEAVAMAKAGWGTADLAGKQKLALAWLSEINGEPYLVSKPQGFPKEFAPPTMTEDHGTFVVEFWSEHSGGMEPKIEYTKNRVVFAANGEAGEITTSERFETRYHDDAK